MVNVSAYRVVETEEGDKYIRLILYGDPEMVRSEKTGNFYATVKQASITATFDEETAKKMIGKQLPGRIEKMETEPYEYETAQGTITLHHRWVYRQDNHEIPAEIELTQKESSIVELAQTAEKSKNGIDKIAV